MILGFPLAVAVLAAAIAAALRHFDRLPRLVAALFMFAALMATAAIGPWRAALARLAGTGTGIVALLILLFVGGLVMWEEVVRMRRHHPVRSPVVAMIFGVLGLLAWGMLARISHLAAQAPGKTGSALAMAVSQIHSGKSAASVPASHTLAPLLLGLLVIGGLVVLGMKFRGRGHVSSRSSRPAISARPGQTAGNASSGQPGPPARRP